ncbi:hypothetical protein D3C71_1719460 [compost metagenome]
METDLAEDMPLHEQSRSLDEGNISVGLVAVTQEKLLAAVQMHIVSPFSYNIGACPLHDPHTIR